MKTGAYNFCKHNSCTNSEILLGTDDLISERGTDVRTKNNFLACKRQVIECNLLLLLLLLILKFFYRASHHALDFYKLWNSCGVIFTLVCARSRAAWYGVEQSIWELFH